MMITASNVAPRLVASMYDQFAAGRVEKAQETNYKLYPLFRAVSLGTSPIPVKYMLKKLGATRSNEHRLPMVPATAEVEKQLDAVLAQIGLTQTKTNKAA